MSEQNDILKDLFIPTWENKPPYRKPIISLNGVSILRFQNVICIVAQPGAGKSTVSESVISSVIDENCDCLGFKTTIKRAMYIDFERAQEDVWTSFERVMKRSKISPGKSLDNIQIISFRNIATSKLRKERIEALLELHKPELLLLDGVGDLLDDTNSLEQAIECKNWVRFITSKFNLSILTTLHPNKGSLNPRGHIGSEMLRESEGVLAITVDANEIRTLSSDFQFGKARNGAHATTCFEWSDENKMFMSCEVVHKIKLAKLPPEEKLTHEELIQLVRTTHNEQLTATDTSKRIEEYLKTNITYIQTSNTNIVQFIKYLECNNYLTVTKIGRNRYYYLHVNYQK
jgi:GTPase SAR1 family protein